MLRDRIQKHGTSVWLVNTGWTGGPYGVGHRMSLAHTRSLLRAALNGDLDGVETIEDPVFGIRVPVACCGLEADVLQPRASWADKNAYDAQSQKLAGMFRANFGQYEDHADPEVIAAGPLAGR